MDTSWTQSEKARCALPNCTSAGGNPAVKSGGCSENVRPPQWQPDSELGQSDVSIHSYCPIPLDATRRVFRI